MRLPSSDCRRSTHRQAGGAFWDCSRQRTQQPTAPTATAESPSDDEEPPERRAAPGAGGGPRTRRGRRGRVQVGSRRERTGVGPEEAGALVGEEEHDRRATDGHPDERDEASDDDDERGRSEVGSGVRGVGRRGRTRRLRSLCWWRSRDGWFSQGEQPRSTLEALGAWQSTEGAGESIFIGIVPEGERGGRSEDLPSYQETPRSPMQSTIHESIHRQD